ncbi:MAG: response regulator [Planctomycetota bacterium]|nr:response regulator [Planctomycetota bacterium]
MLNAAQALARLAGDTKALILISEYRLGRLSPGEIQDLMALLASTDLERIGILELVRRHAPSLGLEAMQIDHLLQTLAAAQIPATPTAMNAAPPVASASAETAARLSAWESRTIRLAKPETPAGAKSETSTPAPSFQVRVSETARQRRNIGAEPTPPSPAVAPHLPPTRPAAPPRSEAFYGSGVSGTAIHRMADRKVLVADDDNRIRMVFRKRLEDSGFLVEEAISGAEAWEKIQESRFALIVMDMKMPGMHGLELLARFSTMAEKPAVIVCSAYEQLRDDFVVKNYPRLRFLVKPVAAETLIAAINELLAANP